MENKKKAVSYFCTHKHGTQYTQEELNTLYSKSFMDFGSIDIIEYISDDYSDNSGYTRLLDMCKANEIDIVLIPSISRVFCPINKALECIKEILASSSNIQIWAAFEKKEFSNDDYTRQYIEILNELATRESEMKSRSMRESINHFADYRSLRARGKQ